MKKQLLRIGYLLPLIAFMFSCNTEDNIIVEEPVPEGQEMIFDEKGYNPYLPENMQMAFDSLKSKVYQNFPGARTTTERITLDFTPNNQYVRFLPKDSIEYDTLMSYEYLALFDYPLDKPIVQEGEYIPEPANEAGFNWLYGVVSTEFEFPPVNYEVINDVFLPEYPNTEYNENTSGRIANDSTEIYGMLMGTELYSLYLSGHIGEEETDELLAILEGEEPINGRVDNSAWDSFINGLKSVRNTIGSIFVSPAYAKKANPTSWCWGCIFNSSWTPRGTVRIRDGSLNQPLRGLKVVIHRGLKSITAYTNNNGEFSSWAKFGSRVTYTVHWRNRSSRLFGNRYFRIIDNGVYLTAKHKIRRNTKRRIDYTYTLSSSRPTSKNVGHAIIYLAAHQYYHRDILGLTRPRNRLRIRAYDNADNTGRHKAGNNFWGGSQVKVWLRTGNQYRRGDDIMGTTFHEIAHYTHFHEVKDWFYPANQWEWNRVDCGVKESWATCVEQYLTRIYYPNFDEGYGTRFTFNQMREYNGIFIDLIDDVNQLATRGGNRPDDAIRNVRIDRIEDAVYDNNNNLFSEVMDHIKDSHPWLRDDIDDLFEEYKENVDYDCGALFNKEWE